MTWGWGESGMDSYSLPDQPYGGSLPPARLHLLKVARDQPLLSDRSRQALESLSLVT